MIIKMAVTILTSLIIYGCHQAGTMIDPHVGGFIGILGFMVIMQLVSDYYVDKRSKEIKAVVENLTKKDEQANERLKDLIERIKKSNDDQ